jgi:hypothetical protein
MGSTKNRPAIDALDMPGLRERLLTRIYIFRILRQILLFLVHYKHSECHNKFQGRQFECVDKYPATLSQNCVN